MMNFMQSRLENIMKIQLMGEMKQLTNTRFKILK